MPEAERAIARSAKSSERVEHHPSMAIDASYRSQGIREVGTEWQWRSTNVLMHSLTSKIPIFHKSFNETAPTSTSRVREAMGYYPVYPDQKSDRNGEALGRPDKL